MVDLSSLFAFIMNATMIEKLLQKDIDDMATANEKFVVVLHTDEGTTEVEVRPGELILDAVASALKRHKARFTVSYGGNDVQDGSFTDQGMGPGARLDICMFPSVFSKDGVEAIAADIVKLNPQTNVGKLLRNAKFDTNGVLQEWYLNDNQIATLPESFGNLQVGGDLYLSDNQIATLPESFGNLQVGGDLNLFRNQIATLPESFGNLQVGGTLYLNDNQIATLPESFGNLQVLL